MRSTSIFLAIAALASMGACSKTGNGDIVVDKPVGIQTEKDTLHPPTITTKTDTINTPTVGTRPETLIVQKPVIRNKQTVVKVPVVRKPPQ